MRHPKTNFSPSLFFKDKNTTMNFRDSQQSLNKLFQGHKTLFMVSFFSRLICCSIVVATKQIKIWAEKRMMDGHEFCSLNHLAISIKNPCCCCWSSLNFSSSKWRGSGLKDEGRKRDRERGGRSSSSSSMPTLNFFPEASCIHQTILFM